MTSWRESVPRRYWL